MIVLVQHKKTKTFNVLTAAFPDNKAYWVRPDGLIAGRIGRRLKGYDVLHIFFRKEVRPMLEQERRKDIATALGGIKKILEDLSCQCMIAFGKDYGIREAADLVKQSCTDVVVEIESEGK